MTSRAAPLPASFGRARTTAWALGCAGALLALVVWALLSKWLATGGGAAAARERGVDVHDVLEAASTGIPRARTAWYFCRI